MVGARKMPQSHIHKPPEERNKGSIKYIQSCGEIRSFCCVWWRKGKNGWKKKRPADPVSVNHLGNCWLSLSLKGQNNLTDFSKSEAGPQRLRLW